MMQHDIDNTHACVEGWEIIFAWEIILVSHQWQATAIYNKNKISYHTLTSNGITVNYYYLETYLE